MGFTAHLLDFKASSAGSTYGKMFTSSEVNAIYSEGITYRIFEGYKFQYFVDNVHTTKT